MPFSVCLFSLIEILSNIRHNARPIHLNGQWSNWSIAKMELLNFGWWTGSIATRIRLRPFNANVITKWNVQPAIQQWMAFRISVCDYGDKMALIRCSAHCSSIKAEQGKPMDSMRFIIASRLLPTIWNNGLVKGSIWLQKLILGTWKRVLILRSANVIRRYQYLVCVLNGKKPDQLSIITTRLVRPCSKHLHLWLCTARRIPAQTYWYVKF